MNRGGRQQARPQDIARALKIYLAALALQALLVLLLAIWLG